MVLKNKFFLDITQIKRVEYRDDITTLRALAVIAVVLFHAEISFFSGGWLGVDVFFVISGYLISNLIISELNLGTFKLRNFYFRRFKRIYPTLIFTIFLTSIVSFFILKPLLIIEYLNSIYSSIFFYSNIYFNTVDFYISGSAKFKPLLHTWSLAVEEQVYIFVPILFLVTYKFNKYILFYLILFASTLSVFLNSTVVGFEKFYLTQYRIWEFFLGTLAVFIGTKFRTKGFNHIIFILLLTSFYYFDEKYILQFEPKFIVNLLTFLVLLNSNSNNIFYKINDIKIVEKIGKASYSIYLIHQPVFALIESFKLRYQFEFNKIIVVLIVIIFSFLLSNYFEFPFLKYFSKLKLCFLIFLTVSCLLFAYFGINDNGYQSRYKSYEKIFSVGADRDQLLLKNNAGYVCGGLGESYCEFGSNNLNTIVLVADSTGEFLAPYFLNQIENRYKFIPLIGDEFYRCTFYKEEIKEQRGSGDCNGSEQTTFKNFVLNNKNFTYIFFASYQRFNKGWLDLDNKYEYFFELILNENNLIFITPAPFVLEEKHIINDLYLNFIYKYGDTIAYPSNLWYPIRDNINNKITEFNKNVRIFDFTYIFCRDIKVNYCVNAYDDKILYFDNVHLSRAGNEYLVDSMFKNLNFVNYIFP